jgi:outer membrane protein TolC
MPVNLSQFQRFVENPPETHARVAFLFRQAQAKRAQAETALVAAEKAVEAARATLSEATGYQKALQDVITFEIERDMMILKAAAPPAEPQSQPDPPAQTNGASA